MIVIFTPLGLRGVHSNIYAIGKKKKGTSETFDPNEAASRERPGRCKSNLKTSAIKRITEHVSLLRKIRTGREFGRHGLTIYTGERCF